MPINWSSKESRDKLLAAMVASLGPKNNANYTEIAKYFGDGATYHTIENQFRAIRRQANELRAAVENGDHTVPNPKSRKTIKGSKGKNGSSGRGSIKPTEEKKRHSPAALISSTISGRISKSKSKSITPGKMFGENGFAVFEDPALETSFVEPAPGNYDGANDFLSPNADFSWLGGEYYDSGHIA